MADQTELKVWEPKHPRIAAIGEYLKRVRDASTLGSLVVGNKGDLLEKIAYGDRLTSGKGETLRIDPDLMELADVVPSPGTLAKGAKMASVIGPIGISNLDDAALKKAYRSVFDKLRKVGKMDWKTQKSIVEAEGFVPIPRGRDTLEQLGTIRYGYELPEIMPSTKFLGEVTDFPAMTKEMPLSEAIQGSRLLRAYPSFENIKVAGDPTKAGGGSLSVSSWPYTIYIGGGLKDPKKGGGTLKHELQHAIQRREGWPQGTNPDQARALIQDLMESQKLQGAIKKGVYSQMTPREVTLARLLRRQRDLIDPMVEAKQLPIDSPRRKNLEQLLPHQMYRREAGEQVAEAVSRNYQAGRTGKIWEQYDVDPTQMYDLRLTPPSFE